MPLSCRALQRQAAGHRRPNIVLILTDDQGYGDLGCHGNDKLKTPHLDRLASQSVEFTRFHVSPVCAPTRASLLTGRYNYRTGAIDTYLGRAMMYTEEVTLAEMLGAAGYRTGIFGKWHLGDNYPLRAIDQGFQQALVHNGGGIGQPADPPGNSYFDPVLQLDGKATRGKGYCTDIFTNAAIQFIEKHRGEPFFAYLATNTPHSPLQIGDQYVAPYKAMGLDDKTARVYGMISNIDDNVGRLLAKLDELKLADETIVIFMTDNGPCPSQQDAGKPRRYNAGLRNAKGSVYDGGIRVPCFVRWPARLKPGAQIDRIAAHIDVVPTLLDACGVARPADVELDGTSLMPLMLGNGADWPDRTLCFQWHRGDVPEVYRNCAARSQRYKLIDGKELYDMVADPAEARNVAADHPDIVAQMRKGYEEWFRDVSATRGYDPPRIHLGTPHEDPTTLTRQDWRGPRAGWDAKSLGHWLVTVARAGSYRIALRFAATGSPMEAHFRLGEVASIMPIPEGASSCAFDAVSLRSGDGQLEAWLSTGQTTIGVHYVDIRRLGN